MRSSRLKEMKPLTRVRGQISFWDRVKICLSQLLNIYHLRSFEETFSLQLRGTVLLVNFLPSKQKSLRWAPYTEERSNLDPVSEVSSMTTWSISFGTCMKDILFMIGASAISKRVTLWSWIRKQNTEQGKDWHSIKPPVVCLHSIIFLPIDPLTIKIKPSFNNTKSQDQALILESLGVVYDKISCIYKYMSISQALLALNKICLVHLNHIYWIYTICQYVAVELGSKLNLFFFSAFFIAVDFTHKERQL